jgi:hypothetical protein
VEFLPGAGDRHQTESPRNVFGVMRRRRLSALDLDDRLASRASPAPFAAGFFSYLHVD